MSNPPKAVSLGASVGLAGLIAGAYSAVNLLGNLGAGYWTDRLGEKVTHTTSRHGGNDEEGEAFLQVLVDAYRRALPAT